MNPVNDIAHFVILSIFELLTSLMYVEAKLSPLHYIKYITLIPIHISMKPNRVILWKTMHMYQFARTVSRLRMEAYEIVTCGLHLGPMHYTTHKMGIGPIMCIFSFSFSFLKS